MVSSMHSLSIIIPVYNSAPILEKLAARLGAVLPDISSAYEVIFVCDGSPDDSWHVIQDICKTYQHMKGLHLARNYGQHNALLAGIKEAQYDVIVTMDDDLQHPPEEIHKLLAKLDEGHDVVYGTPESLKHSIGRNVASVLTKWIMQHSMGYENASHVNAFRVFKTRIRDAFMDYCGKFVSIDILLTWGTNKFSHIAVRHDARAEGQSNYTLRKLVLHAVNIITSFSALPLQIASLLGFCFMIIGLGLFGYVILNYFISGVAVEGFTFLASMIAVFAGVQLFSLGVIGEYLSRIHFRTMGQPTSVVKERTGD